MSNAGSVLRSHKFYWITIFILLLWCLYSMFIASRICNPVYRVGWSLTKSEVRSAMGDPQGICLPGEPFVSGGAYPKPPTPHQQEVWTYGKLMKLTFVYFDKNGRVQMVFYATT